MNVSLIIVTYNRPEYLNLVLQSVRQQSVPPTQVVIADDGSKQETKELIDNIRKDYPIELTHVWHEDKGFRSSRIRNKAINAVTGDYVIFLDGDLIMHENFIEDYLQVAQKRKIVIGNRAFLSKEETERVVDEGVIHGTYSLFDFKKIEKNYVNLIRIKNTYKLLKLHTDPATLRGARGGMAGIFLEDIVAVDGFDAAFEGWGAEDTDFVFRLMYNGCSVQKLKFQGLTYHLHHELLSRNNLNTNSNLLNDLRASKRVKAIEGCSKSEK